MGAEIGAVATCLIAEEGIRCDRAAFARREHNERSRGANSGWRGRIGRHGGEKSRDAPAKHDSFQVAPQALPFWAEG